MTSLQKQPKTSGAMPLNHGFIQGIDTLSIRGNVFSITLIHYAPDSYHEGLFEHYSILKPSALAHWLPQRQAQFLAGRLAVKAAIQFLSCSDVQIPIGPQREPIWPENYVGSISHSEHTSITAITEKLTPQSGLGIDIQSLIDTDTRTQIASTVLLPHEISLIQQEGELSESVLFTLVFSAKESFFKAVFYNVKRHFDFDAISLVNIDKPEQRLTFEVVDRLSHELPKGYKFDVSFIEIDSAKQQVITSCDWKLFRHR